MKATGQDPCPCDSSLLPLSFPANTFHYFLDFTNLETEAQRGTLFRLNWATSHPPKISSGRRSNRRREKVTLRTAHSKKASWRK